MVVASGLAASASAVVSTAEELSNHVAVETYPEREISFAEMEAIEPNPFDLALDEMGWVDNWMYDTEHSVEYNTEYSAEYGVEHDIEYATEYIQPDTEQNLVQDAEPAIQPVASSLDTVETELDSPVAVEPVADEPVAVEPTTEFTDEVYSTSAIDLMNQPVNQPTIAQVPEPTLVDSIDAPAATPPDETPAETDTTIAQAM
jgi:hypothetical protein